MRRRTRQTRTVVAVATVFALTGPASTLGHLDGSHRPESMSLSSSEKSDVARQPAASLTRAGDSPPLAPAPAVHIGLVSDPAGPRRTAVPSSGIPAVLLSAYRSAAAGAPAACHLPVSLLAAIGEVESGSLAGRTLDARHRTSIFGPVLDGHGVSAVPDTDQGRLDGNATWDRAVGPMQFIPSTWRLFGVDGDGDGVADPQDLEDASASTAAYLCYGGRDLRDPATLGSAILSYNHSTSYERLVLTYQRRYAGLGLDRGVTLSRLPAVGQALVATPVAGLDGGSAAGRRRSATVHHARRATPAPASARPSAPVRTPAASPTATAHPTLSPTASPTGSPTASPTGTPTASPTVPASCPPTPSPSVAPTSLATQMSSPAPTGPTSGPTTGPTTAPTCPPCGSTPTSTASPTPTATPTTVPAATPTCVPVDGASPTAASPSSAP
ncbi:MAG: lytic murein transglycosylase [Nocardioidaceae bacterium]